jgi:hypothetical protein
MVRSHFMPLFALWLVLLLVSAPSQAQLTPIPRAIQPISDPAMVVNDRGAKLEVYPTKRATVGADAAGRASTHRVFAASATSPLGPQQLGVVFNHAMQAQGYITGEIAFKMKAGHTVTGFDPSLYPGLKKVTSPAVYVVNARTPVEFMKSLKRLQARSDIEWVEPTVTYGSAERSPPIQ